MTKEQRLIDGNRLSPNGITAQQNELSVIVLALLPGKMILNYSRIEQVTCDMYC